MTDLAGRGVLVTGASRGIGRAVAHMFGTLGAAVGIGCRRPSNAAEEAVEEVRAAGAADAFLCVADLAVPAEAAGVVEQVISRVGGIDVLVNNAAIARSQMLHRMSDEEWLDVIAVNLNAAFFSSRAALRVMRQQRRGHIINVASASSVMAHPGASSYIASKHALVGLTKSLAVESARHGIFVNAVAPGLTNTDMTAEMSDGERDRLLARVPLGRVAEPQEHASLIRWLVTEARYSTGNVFHTSGGVVMG